MTAFNAQSIRHFSMQQQNLLFFFQSVYLAEPAHCAAEERAVTRLVFYHRGFWAVFGALCPVSGWVTCPGFPWLSLPQLWALARERMLPMGSSHGITGQPVPQFPLWEMRLTALPCGNSQMESHSSDISIVPGLVIRAFPRKQSPALAKPNSCPASWHTARP